MILADSSIWIDHIRQARPALLSLLHDEMVLIHPFVIGEIALGSIKDRTRVVAELSGLLRSEVAEHDEVMTLVERHSLFGKGIGYVDAHLLAATLLTPGTRLWTDDRRLANAADQLGVAERPTE